MAFCDPVPVAWVLPPSVEGVGGSWAPALGVAVLAPGGGALRVEAGG